MYLTNNDPDNLIAWNNYVLRHERATIYHDIRWKKVIEDTFGHKPLFLYIKDGDHFKGILPLFLMKSFIFGNYLISLPFIDTGGVLADDAHSAHHLVDLAIAVAQKEKVDFLELRNTYAVEHSQLITKSQKVYCSLSLTPDPQVIWKNVIHENVRNKVRKALKNQLRVEMGNSEQFLSAFHHVFSLNMRYLGTPCYPKKFFFNIAKEFPDEMKIFLIYYKDRVIGGKMVFFFKDTVYFIYHSSSREYAKLAPNNLLYWTAIEYACNNNYKICNMGRSNINSGPFDFKKKWGGEVKPLYWQYYVTGGKDLPQLNPQNPKFSLAIECWKKMPLSITNLIGPLIAKHIP